MRIAKEIAGVMLLMAALAFMSGVATDYTNQVTQEQKQ